MTYPIESPSLVEAGSLVAASSNTLSILATPDEAATSPVTSFVREGDELDHPGGAVAAEKMLKWPILAGFAPENSTSLLWLPDPEDTTFQMAPRLSMSQLDKVPPPRSTVDETQIVGLVDKYLAMVYLKNPILEPSELKRHAAQISEFGCEWNGESCRVVSDFTPPRCAVEYLYLQLVQLLACALAIIVKGQTGTWNSWEERSKHYSHKALPTDRASADAYYLAARKRLGLLDLSLLSAQCHYLAGIYEMCSMRPLQAWNQYRQAAVNTQIVLWRESESGVERDKNVSSMPRQILERLYFSCIRTERYVKTKLGKVSFSNSMTS